MAYEVSWRDFITCNMVWTETETCLSISDAAKHLTQDINTGMLSPVGGYNAIQSRMAYDF